MARIAATPARHPAQPRLRRAYYDCRYGQLHLHNAIPAGGGFDELTAVICVHGAGQTGRVFEPQLRLLGADRSVYAPDLPGCGASDPAPGETAVEAGVHAIGDFVESMRIRAFDLVARAEGCVIARSLAEQRGAAVRRVVLFDDPAGVSRSGPKLFTLTAAESPESGQRLLTILAAT